MLKHFVAPLLLCAFASAIPVTGTAAEPVIAGLKKGDIPPHYVGRQVDGTDVNIDPGSGKVYVISFWASWCPPCLEELPLLSNLQRKVGSDRIQVIAVNVEDKDVYRKLQGPIKELGVTPAYDPLGKSRAAYGVGPIPHMIIIGRDGRILAVRTGYAKSALQSLGTELKNALAQDIATSEHE